MCKFLIFTDIHIHTHKNSLKRLQDCLTTLEWTFETAISRNVKNILFLGDLFQDRQKIQILPYHKTYEMFLKYSEHVNVYILVGNHDMWLANDCEISSVYPFKAIKNVTVIDKPTTLNIGGFSFDFLPYTNNPLESLKEFKKPSKILLGHISIDGAKLNSHYKRIAEVSVECEGDIQKIDSEKFSKWEKVYLGHFHIAQQIGNIEYVGSPLELNFAEAFQEKHIILLNAETMEAEYIVNNFSPRHLILNEDEVSKFDLENTFIRLEPKNIASADLVDMQKDLLNKKALSVEISNMKKLSDQQEVNEAKQIIKTKDKFDMLKVYLDAVDCSNLDKELLLSVGQNLIEKSQVN